jgi:3-hydroxymyristoyl/3-hydroxydecanoyl-(acyl carrier protein) dehydratase
VRTTQSLKVTWQDPLLDSHVLPLGVLFTRLSGLVENGALECDLEIRSKGLPLADDTVATALEVGESRFRMSAQIGDASPFVEIRGPRHAHPTPPAPRAGTPAAHEKRTWSTKHAFNERDLEYVHAGDILPCFGAGFERSAAHTRTPPLPGGRLVRLTSVVALDPTGGPWSLGLLRAKVHPGVDDPAGKDEPGLRLGRLYQAAQQAMAFFVMAAGGTIARDGWRFEAKDGATSHLRFFAAPALDAPLEVELLVESFEGAPWQSIVGDVRVWAGEQLVFAGERLALALIADFPLSSNRSLWADGQADAKSGKNAATIDGFRLDYASMVAGAVGRPVEAFNQAGNFFETGERQMPRLPGPPYHFVTRVTHVEGERLSMKPGAKATMEYDVPEDAWYFDENGNRTMPWCVLLEAALQPCGWLSVYVGCPMTTSENVFFRNLDGAGKMTGEVFPGCTVRTDTRVTSVSNVSGMILISYKIECYVGDREVCNLTAAFGYFSNAALDMQPGLPTTKEVRARLVEESPVSFDLTERPEKYCAGPLRLPGPMLLMVDRVTGYWKGGGEKSLGRLRVEKTVKPHDWYFRSHFYSDPVQPGSLGVEQMLQTLQFFVIEEGLAKDIEAPYFEALVVDSHISWKFRGQVRPEKKLIISEIDIISVEEKDGAVTVLANGSLWVDGTRCYEAKAIGVRVRGKRPAPVLPPRTVDSVLDPAIDAWVTDHRPSYTVPVMPMMSLTDRMAMAALEHVRAAYPAQKGTPEWYVTGGSELRALGWLVGDRKKNLRTEVRPVLSRAVHRSEEVECLTALYELTDAGPKKVASGRIRLGRKFAPPPPAWAPLSDAVPTPLPYATGAIYWGPKLQLMKKLAFSPRGLSAELDAAGADAPIGAVHHILLDGALHGIPHDELEKWSDKIGPGHMGVPVRLTAQFYGPPPAKGTVRAEVRFAGFDGAQAFPFYMIQMIGTDANGRESVWAVLKHVEMLIPFGHRSMTKADRIPFMVERRYKKGVGLSDFHDDRTELKSAEVKRMDGLPGSVGHVYGLERDENVDPRVIAIKDHVGQRAQVHPGEVQVDPGLTAAWTRGEPGKRYPVKVEMQGTDVVVRDASS